MVATVRGTQEDEAAETWNVLGALAPAYALGEGIGRLACIS